MPTYDYYCSECDETIEVFHKISDPALKSCPKCCRESLIRKPSKGSGLSITGDGFYSTMYGDKKAPAVEKNECCPCGKNKSACNNKS